MVRIQCALVVLGEIVLVLGQSNPEKRPKVVEAEQLVLRDPKGQVRAELGWRDGAFSLALFDEKGKRCGGLELLADGSVRLALLSDSGGMNRAVLSISQDGTPQLHLADKEGKMPSKGNGEPAQQQTREPTPAPASPEEQKRLEVARVVYRKLCQTCHAADGKGVTTKSRSSIPDFTDPVWQDSRTDAQVLGGILNGRGDVMPPFDDRLKKEEARDLLAFVRAFGRKQSQQLLPSASDFQTRLGELQRQWDELDKQLRQLRKAAPKKSKDLESEKVPE